MRIIYILIILLCITACKSKDSITKFSEIKEIDKQVYVYPSTLRMVNLKEQEAFNELIGQFEMGRFFRLNYTEENNILVQQLKKDIIKEGYQEILQLNSKEQDIEVYFLENKVPKLAALRYADNAIDVIQIIGLIDITKLPELMQNYNKEDFLNLTNVISLEPDQNNHNHEHHSQH